MDGSVGACGSASLQVSRDEKNNGLAVDDEVMIHSCLLQKQDEEKKV
jgi:hypothetical protein